MMPAKITLKFRHFSLPRIGMVLSGLPVSRNVKGQILLTTVLMMLLVTFIVMSIAAIASRNATQVFNNLRYDESYNYAETKLLQVTDLLSKPEAPINSVPSLLQNVDGYDNCEILGQTKAICSFDEASGTGRRTILQAEDVNYVDNYELGKEEYFEVILSSGTLEYKDTLNIDWLGDTAIELTLLYKDTANAQEIKTAKQVVDSGAGTSSAVYDALGPDKTGSNSIGFLQVNPLVYAGRLSVQLGSLRPTVVPGTAKLLYLRVKAINRTIGSSVTIKPTASGEANFPDQVRLVEVFSYKTADSTDASPVVYTQLPLSPQLPAPLTYALNLSSFRAPMCGNSIQEGKEECDDGNMDDTDNCSNICETCGGNFANWSFEEPAISAGTPWVRRSTGITNWSGQFDQHTDLVAHSGRQVIDLNTSVPGWAEQTISTKAGQSYRLSFWSSVNTQCSGSGSSLVVNMDILVNGLLAGTLTSNSVYQEKLIEFVATSESTTIRFVSKNGTNCGPTLDDVSVTCIDCAKPFGYDPADINCSIPINTSSIWTRTSPWSGHVSAYIDRTAFFISPLAKVSDYCPSTSDKLIFISSFKITSAGNYRVQSIIDNSGTVRIWRDGDPAQQVAQFATNDALGNQVINLPKGSYVVILDALDSGTAAAAAFSIMNASNNAVIKNTKVDGTWCIFRVPSATNTQTFVENIPECFKCSAPDPVCGDSVPELGEACDDGNTNNNDGCSSQCQLECGNGVINPGEACDDGNRIDGDGCTAQCQAALGCADPASRTITTFTSAFAADPSGQCAWGQNGNLPKTGSVFSARKDRTIPLPINPATQELCGLQLSFPNQAFQYNDHVFLRLNNAVLFSTNGNAYNMLDSLGNLKIYDFEKIKGKNHNSGLAAKCIGNVNAVPGSQVCDIAETDHALGKLVLKIPDSINNELSDYTVSQNKYDLTITATGDDDNDDCRIVRPISFTATITTAAK